MRRRYLAIHLISVFAAMLPRCSVHKAPPQTSSVTEGRVTPAAQELTKLKAKLMSADYRADLDELSRLKDEAAGLGTDGDLGYLAHYWSGFASWRIAINGASHQMKAEDLKTHLQKAAVAFYRAIRLKDDFGDAYAAAAGVNSWLATFYMPPNLSKKEVAAMMSSPDMVGVLEHHSLAHALLSRAIAVDPDNPRTLWIKGAFLVYAPEPQIARGIEVYRRMLEVADQRGVNAASPLPDWGKPEARMSLAFALSIQTPPDLRAALDEATAALKLEPDWSYVRDNLIPRLEQRLRPDQR